MTWIAQCGSCRRNYTAEDWKTLRLVGAMDPEDPEDPAHILELRNCKGTNPMTNKDCNSTLSLAQQVHPATAQSRKVAVDTLNHEAKGIKPVELSNVDPNCPSCNTKLGASPSCLNCQNWRAAMAPKPDPTRFGREFHAMPMTAGGFAMERSKAFGKPRPPSTEEDLRRHGREANAIPCTPGGGVADRRAAKKR